MQLREIAEFIRAAIECSVYLEPTDPGLTYQEVMEATKRANYLEGESRDAFEQSGIVQYMGGNRRLLPDDHTTAFWAIFSFREEPELRNFECFDFVVRHLQERARSVGERAAGLDRAILVERGVAAGLPLVDLQAAITILLMCRQLTEEGPAVRLALGSAGRRLPSADRDESAGTRTMEKPARRRALPIVKDIIERRTDRRPNFAEPIDAFVDQLAPLGYEKFRLWWTQTAAELRQSDPQSAPLSTTVLSAALVEGALTFVVSHGRALGSGVFGSSTFEKPARNWKIDDLVASAAMGRENAILDERTKLRALSLIHTRQRIHAGRMLMDYPSGVPDLRPEEARDAKATADAVVRSVLDWLDKNPPSP